MSSTVRSSKERRGPLVGLRVIEFASIGPGPYCAMLLADLGAEVLRIDRPGGNGWPNTIVDRGRYTLRIDVHEEVGRDLCLLATDKADVLIEGLRPGVMERLQLGPEVVMARNPRLIYGRSTGWGQTGRLSRVAGHDVNFIALAGALAALGRCCEPPVPPLNLVGDLAGGALFLAFGVLSALWERERSGAGQVIDAAIVDGVASMMAMFGGLPAEKNEALDRVRSLLGGSAPFYGCYRCADGRDIAVGALEPKFYLELINRTAAPDEMLDAQYEVSNWRARREILAKLFAQKTQAQWCQLLEGSEACFAPVLTLAESQSHPHLADRSTYVEFAGLTQPAPTPKFSRTPGAIAAGGSGIDLLKRWGVPT